MMGSGKVFKIAVWVLDILVAHKYNPVVLVIF